MRKILANKRKHYIDGLVIERRNMCNFSHWLKYGPHELKQYLEHEPMGPIQYKDVVLPA